MTLLPCTTRLDVYDALFDDEAPEQQATAHPIAVRLCASCPAPCPEKVTEASAPREVELLPDGWLPRTTVGHAGFTGLEPWHGRADAVQVHGCRCQRCTDAYQPDAKPSRQRVYWPKSRAYVPVNRRIQVWAADARRLQEAGATVQGIADQLCVTADTAQALLQLPDPQQHPAIA